jgi:hypothetical protein
MIGVFSGHGDVILAMGATFVLGFVLGGKVRHFIHWIKGH